MNVRPTVLVIDAAASSRRSICERLESEGLSTAAAADATDANRWFRSATARPVVIVAAIADEFTLGRFLAVQQLTPELREVSVVVLTGDPRVMDRARELEKAQVVKLPYDLDQLSLIARAHAR